MATVEVVEEDEPESRLLRVQSECKRRNGRGLGLGVRESSVMESDINDIGEKMYDTKLIRQNN